MTHLSEQALEALATDREDLVSELELDHLDACERCAALVAEEAMSARDASVGLRRAMPEIEDLDSMIARAMAHADEDALASTVSPAPSRRSLWLGAGIGTLIAAALAVLSAPGVGSLSSLGGQTLTLARAADRVVSSAMPGGWTGIALAGLAAALLLAIPARLLLRDSGRGASLLTGTLAALLIGMVATPAATAHAYRVDGAWPTPTPRVALDVERQPVSEALRQACRSAGLGVVVHLEDDSPVTLHVSDAPLDEVVEALLGDRDVVVQPGASLVTVRADTVRADTVRPDTADTVGTGTVGADTGGADVEGAAAAQLQPDARPAPPPIPEAPPTPSPGLVTATPRENTALDDVVTLGSDVTVRAGDHVRGVYTMGGDASVLGHAYGDVVTMGGDAAIEGEVIGNITTMGGDIALGPAARVHGDLNAMGGEVEVHERAVVYGRLLSNGERSGDDASPAARVEESSPGIFRWALWNALLFLFGLLMLGAGRERFANLRAELAARPVRSAFGGMFGAMAGAALTVVFTLTILGIPGAVVVALLLASGYVVGWSTSAWWLGSVLPLPFAKDRPVAQLAVGVGVLFLLGLVPAIGGLLVTLAALAGLGAVITTSFGKNPRKPKARAHTPTGPFAPS